jgi:hypothetical protein
MLSEQDEEIIGAEIIHRHNDLVFMNQLLEAISKIPNQSHAEQRRGMLLLGIRTSSSLSVTSLYKNHF